MGKYKVFQKYASVSHYRHNKPLKPSEKYPNLNTIGIFEAKDIVEAIRLASRQSTVPQLCLSASLVKEVL